MITNTSRRGAYRGPWMFETIARELMLDIAARNAGIDPLELRRRNIVQQADLPYTTTTGATFDRVTPAETLEQAAAMLDYDAFRREQAAARADGRLLGVGIACYVEPTAGGFGVGITESDHDPHRPERLHPGDQRRELAGSQHGDDHRPGHRRVPRRRRRRRRGDVRRHRDRADGRDHRREPQRGLRRRRGAPGGARDARARVPDRRPHARGVARRPRHGRWRGLGAGHAVGAEDARRGRAPRLHDPEASFPPACRPGSRSPRASPPTGPPGRTPRTSARARSTRAPGSSRCSATS